jgi:lipoprotein NlpI
MTPSDFRNILRHPAVVAMLCLAAFNPAAPAAEAGSPARARDLAQQARAAAERGDTTNALKLATEVIAADTNSPAGYSLRARLHEAARQDASSAADYDEAIRRAPRDAGLHQRRGWVRFRLGRFAEALADFDVFLERHPEQNPHHWQRGIVCYYAGRFEEGRRQFESHQTVNAHDVENAVWHFLCLARESSVAKARAALIPIEDDRRVPMMEVHALFSGKAKPEDVLAAASAGNPAPGLLNDRLFFAHLYLGLYCEATGDAAKTREHILRSVDDFKSDHAMGDVARVHAARLRPSKP